MRAIVSYLLDRSPDSRVDAFTIANDLHLTLPVVIVALYRLRQADWVVSRDDEHGPQTRRPAAAGQCSYSLTAAGRARAWHAVRATRSAPAPGRRPLPVDPVSRPVW